MKRSAGQMTTENGELILSAMQLYTVCAAVAAIGGVAAALRKPEVTAKNVAAHAVNMAVFGVSLVMVISWFIETPKPQIAPFLIGLSGLAGLAGLQLVESSAGLVRKIFEKITGIGGDSDG